MANDIKISALLEEFNREVPATRKCLERIGTEYYSFKPHPRSMQMKYLALLVAEIPQWLVHMMQDDSLDLATYPQYDFSSSEELLARFDQNVKDVNATFSKFSDNALQADFSLKRDGQTLYTVPKSQDIPVTLNHWVHHRGQLTVYMRMCEIKVPSLYGPSADERTF